MAASVPHFANPAVTVGEGEMKEDYYPFVWCLNLKFPSGGIYNFLYVYSRPLELMKRGKRVLSMDIIDFISVPLINP